MTGLSKRDEILKISLVSLNSKLGDLIQKHKIENEIDEIEWHFKPIFGPYVDHMKFLKMRRDMIL